MHIRRDIRKSGKDTAIRVLEAAVLTITTSIPVLAAMVQSSTKSSNKIAMDSLFRVSRACSYLLQTCKALASFPKKFP